MADEFKAITGRHSPCVITGKPLPVGGSAGRDEATGRGAYLCLRRYERRLDLNPQDSRVAIQGFGNAGYHCARELHAAGYRIVAVSDSSACRLDPEGMDPQRVMQHKERTGSVAGAPSQGQGRDDEPGTVLRTACEVLVPAALADQIRADNAREIGAKVIVEIANGPVRVDADEPLAQAGVTTIPDILANAGGVVVSHLEWVQNKTGLYWSLADVRGRLEETMERQSDAVWRIHEDEGVSLRTAAYLLGLTRICEAASALGTQTTLSSG
jgi:glutamate dehydrogenase (NADP+)